MNYRYYYTYKITCTEGSFKGKFYFGQHKTNNLDDQYKGSGKKLRDYYKKYSNGYIKEILNFYDSQEDLNKAEYNLIHNWLGHEQCLNIYEGGNSGPEHSWNLGIHRTDAEKQKISEGTKLGLKRSGGAQKISKKHKGRISTFKGHKHSAESKNKISESGKGRAAWNKGLTTSEESKEKNRAAHLGKHRVYDNPERTKYHME